MNIFKTNNEDSVYWLKVAMRQAQSDIKLLKNEVEILRTDNKYLRTKYEAMELDTVQVTVK